eukprot:2149476-Prymnesium_polylepis.1
MRARSHQRAGRHSMQQNEAIDLHGSLQRIVHSGGAPGGARAQPSTPARRARLDRAPHPNQSTFCARVHRIMSRTAASGAERRHLSSACCAMVRTMAASCT